MHLRSTGRKRQSVYTEQIATPSRWGCRELYPRKERDHSIVHVSIPLAAMLLIPPAMPIRRLTGDFSVSAAQELGCSSGAHFSSAAPVHGVSAAALSRVATTKGQAGPRSLYYEQSPFQRRMAGYIWTQMSTCCTSVRSLLSLHGQPMARAGSSAAPLCLPVAADE